MDSSARIPRKTPSHDSLDFDHLQSTGIEALQQLSGKIWTDYNVHDPGVTLVEILSYAITELGFRTRFPVKDLLTSPGEEKAPTSAFFAPDQILPSAAVTAEDYNRLFLNIEGIRIARMVPSRRNPDFHGIFDLEVQMEEGADPEDLRFKIMDLYHSNGAIAFANDPGRLLRTNRNLCEDLDEIHFLEETSVRFNLSVEVGDNIDEQQLLADLVHALREYLSPPVEFHKHTDLLADGMAMEDILNGPRLIFGAIREDLKEKLALRQEIRTSDVLQMMAELPEVEEVKHCGIFDRFNNYHPWICKVEHGKVPVLDREGSRIEMFNKAGVRLYAGSLQSAKNALGALGRLRTVYKSEEYRVGSGQFLAPEAYHSLQNEFPRVYGIGDTGLPASATPQRRGQAKQFQGFLLFFEQCLANFFSQVAHLKELFSIDQIDQTRFYQGLFDVPGAEYLFQPFVNRFIQRHVDLEDEKALRREWDEFRQGYLEWKQFQRNSGISRHDTELAGDVWRVFAAEHGGNRYLEGIKELDERLYQAIESQLGFMERRNQMLDHLLARFAIDAADFHFTGSESPTLKQRIDSKLQMLNSFAFTSRSGGTGADLGPFNTSGEAAPEGAPGELAVEENVSGLESILRQIFRIAARPLNHLNYWSEERFLLAEAAARAGRKDGFLDIEMFDTSGDKAILDLFRLGSDPQNLRATGRQKRFELRDESGQVVGMLAPPRRRQRRMDVDAETIAARIRRAGEEAECLYLVEHLALRPLRSCSEFGFAIHSPESGELLFESRELRNWDEREEALLTALDLGRTAESYRVFKVNRNQYKVMLQCPGFNLLGPLFIESREGANARIQDYVRDFRALYELTVAHNSQAEKLFRTVETEAAGGMRASQVALSSMFEAGSDPDNYEQVATEGGAFLQFRHPESQVIFRSYQPIRARDAATLEEIVREFRDYSVGYFRRQFRSNLYANPRLRFHTRQKELLWGTDDPWSNIITVLLPSWPRRFQNRLLRSYVEKTIYAFAPAHLVVNVRWMDHSELAEFENKYRRFLLQRKAWQAQRSEAQPSDSAASHRAESALRDLEKELTELGNGLLELITRHGK
ncbi:MAG: hypothetical protein AAF998_03465 [Bacteroidota bacterium]